MHGELLGSHVTTRGALMLLMMVLLNVGCALSPTVERRFDRFDADIRGHVEPHKVLSKFDQLFSGAYSETSLSRVADSDLTLLFRAAEYAAYYDGPQALEGMSRALEEMERRGMASGRDYSEFIRHLVTQRQFERAQMIFQRAAQPRLTPPPIMVDSVAADWQGATELHVDDGVTVTRRAVDLSGLHIIVAWHPDCHFSRRAYQHISSEPLLSELLSTYGRLLAPPRDTYKSRSLRDWNRTHPSAPVSIAYRNEEWPGIDFNSLPTFHFLRDGVVLAKVVGWPSEGRREEFLVAARAAGMLEPAARR